MSGIQTYLAFGLLTSLLLSSPAAHAQDNAPVTPAVDEALKQVVEAPLQVSRSIQDDFTRILSIIRPVNAHKADLISQQQFNDFFQVKDGIRTQPETTTPSVGPAIPEASPLKPPAKNYRGAL